MIAFYFLISKCFGNCQSSFKFNPERTVWDSVFSGPLSNALCFALVLNKYVAGLLHAVSASWNNGQRIINRPPISDSPCYQRLRYSSLSAPFGCAKRLTHELNIYVGRKVGLLFCDVCPPAVVWSVSKASIDPVDCGSCRTLAHVVQKVLEGFSPAVANNNSLATIHRVLRGIFVVAPSQHCVVSRVSGALGATCSVSMLLLSSAGPALLTAKTSFTLADFIRVCKKRGPAKLAESRDFVAAHLIGLAGLCDRIIPHKVKGVVWRGLTNRRQKERALCLEGGYS